MSWTWSHPTLDHVGSVIESFARSEHHAGDGRARCRSDTSGVYLAVRACQTKGD